MPFYEYQCKNCGHELEAMQKVSDTPLKKCPHCGKSQLQRLMSAPVFRLKGSGWYETDFKDDKDKKRNLAEHPDADKPKDTDSKADAKGDKPESKSDGVAEKPPAVDSAKTKDSESGTKTKTEPSSSGKPASKKASPSRNKSRAKKSSPKNKRKS